MGATAATGTTTFTAGKSWSLGLEKVNEMAKQVKKLRIYFNNHYAGAAIINAMQFEEMENQELSDD
jgi:hypothetical protein